MNSHAERGNKLQVIRSRAAERCQSRRCRLVGQPSAFSLFAAHSICSASPQISSRA